MGRSETIAQINKIKNNYDAFQSQIYELASKISSFSDEINEIDYRTIKHETTISLINASMNKINGDVNNIISRCASTSGTVEIDANKKIEELVDAYNRSIPEDSEETPLSYSTVSPSRLKASTGNGTNTTSGGSNPSNNYNNNNSDTPNSTNTLDYYFKHASENKLNSNSIDGWDGYINEFLNENNLSSYVNSITIVDGEVICTLSNGQVYKYNNVTGIVDLLKKLKNSINGGNVAA